MKYKGIASSHAAVIILIVANISTCLAESTENSLHVSARVVAKCRIDTNFAIDPENIAISLDPDLAAANNVDWSCTNGASPELSITSSRTIEVEGRIMDNSAFSSNSLSPPSTRTAETDAGTVVDVTLEF